jgi:hypothetical protein
MFVTTQHEREVDMVTELDPFIAGLSFGAVIGTGPLLTPRFCGLLLVLVLLWMVFLCWQGGLSGVEAAALSVIQEIAEHARLALGLGVGAVLSFSTLRHLTGKQ